jgi:hypothetical protein
MAGCDGFRRTTGGALELPVLTVICSAPLRAMSSLPSRQARLSLYANLLRASRSFASYNFRSYFLRNTRTKFRLAASETDPSRIRALYDDFNKELGVLRRSAAVNRMYEGPKLVVEKPRVKTGGGAGMEAGAERADQLV